MSNYLVYLQTVQAAAFKNLIEATKELLTETNIEFDEKGMRIVAMDESHTVLVHLRLNADKFEEYICNEPRIAGVSIPNLFKVFKSTNNNEILTIYIDSRNENMLGIRFENGDQKEISEYEVNLMDLNEEQIDIPDIEYPFTFDYPSARLQKICRNLKNLAPKHIEIQYVTKRNELIFSANSDIANNHRIRLQASENSDDCLKMVKVPDDNEMYVGNFNLEKLTDFTKCSGLGNNVQICLKSDNPLILIYPIGYMGEITLCLAPMKILEDL
jgi:proliferating cell nuclear antigen